MNLEINDLGTKGLKESARIIYINGGYMYWLLFF